MDKNFEVIAVDISALLFDCKNPRIYFSNPKNQQEALNEIMRLHGNHTLALAKHIARWGLLEYPIITDDSPEKKKENS